MTQDQVTEPCDSCVEGSHDECERPVHVRPPSRHSDDGLSTVEQCCCPEPDYEPDYESMVDA